MRLRSARLPELVLTVALLSLAACNADTTEPSASPVSLSPTPEVSKPQPRLPPINGRFDYQIGGVYPPAASVRIVDRDETARPVAGLYNICYVNAFQSQPQKRKFWKTHHPHLLLRNADGSFLTDPNWPGEFIFDTSTNQKRSRLTAIIDDLFARCANKGFQAIEPDNLDSWTRSRGQLTKADNMAMATRLATDAHARGLAIAQKNTSEFGIAGRTKVHFDFAIAEECQVYSECGSYTRVYGRHVIEVEYTDNPRSAYTTACAARGKSISIILRDRQVVAKGRPGYHYKNC